MAFHHARELRKEVTVGKLGHRIRVSLTDDTFSAYDLYSKSDEPPKVEELKSYYMTLIKKYFPDEIEW